MGPRAELALDVLEGRPAKGIPSWILHVMEHRFIEKFAGAQPGDYVKNHVQVYLDCQHELGACMVDQYIPDNPLSIGCHGYEGGAHGATTGATELVLDGLVIDSPEAVCQHLEQFVFPALAAQPVPDEAAIAQAIIASERSIQAFIEPWDLLKTPYGVAPFPGLAYGSYGYVYYFMACALYPEVIERHFSLQADWSEQYNRGVARAYVEGKLPNFLRLDHDMADSRSTLNREDWLDEHWFPHFERSIRPLVEAGIDCIWHCDGNLMAMVPRLLDCGLVGFQGFQYEDGMDYEKICGMKTREGEELLIIAGVSVTRTLPFGAPEDVKREIDFLVEHGPKGRLFLGGSSSIAPGVSWENLVTLRDGLAWYREHGRKG
jgi:hypothetical protein